MLGMLGGTRTSALFIILFISVCYGLAHRLGLEVKSERFDKLVELPLHDAFELI